MSDFFRKHSMITGTLLLTAAGFAVRILGFFYRIFLSRTIGAEGLGLYNLVHPLYGICFALCAGSIQTAISRCIAANLSRRKLFLRTGLMISLSIAVILAMILSAGSQFLADQILLESRCGEFLRLMALSIPFSAIHACVNGYYYGMQRTRVPAASQITEQLIRMGVVFLLVLFFQAEQIPITTELAVLGHLAGEAGSCFYAALTFLIFDHTVSSPCLTLTSPIVLSTLCAGRELMSMALPLMGNRLILNLLSSAEAIWIPSRLVLSGLTSREAFELYGVLTGMALPFIFFPSAITNSMAVILLPAVAGAQADGREHHIREAVLTSLRYSLYMGILCIGVFTCFGDFLGNIVFHESSAGYFRRFWPGFVFSLPGYYHRKYLKWSRKDQRCIFTKYRRLKSPPGLCIFRHSPVWHPRLSMGDVSQRTLSVCHASVYIKRAGFFFYPAMGYDSETNPLFTDFCGNLPLRPAICFLFSQISGLFHSPDPDFPASFLLHRLAGPVPFFQAKDRRT